MDNIESSPNNPKIKSISIIVAAVIAVIILGYAMTKNSSKTSETNTIASSTTETQNQDSQNTITQEPIVQEPSSSSSSSTSENAQSNIKTFTVTGKNFSYNPKEIKVNKGDTVKIIFKDTDGHHNLVIDGYNAQTQTIDTDNESTVEFVADKTGTFDFYCSVDSHKAKGMVGKLIVQ